MKDLNRYIYSSNSDFISPEKTFFSPPPTHPPTHSFNFCPFSTFFGQMKF